MPRVERWLITGASGQLGGHVVRQLLDEDEPREILGLVGRQTIAAAGVEARSIDLADHDALRSCVEAFRPDHVLHLGAMTAVADCYAHPELPEAVNVQATRVLAEATGSIGARMLFASTDMVFGGDDAPYRESDPPRPVSCYGRGKAAAEQWLSGRPRMLTVRLPLMYGLPCWGRETGFARQIATLQKGQPLRLFTDEFRTPVWLPDAARALVALARDDVEGVLHLAGPERLSRYDLLARCAELLGIDRPDLIPTLQRDIAAPEPRPKDLSLSGELLARVRPDLLPGPLRPEVFAVM